MTTMKTKRIRELIPLLKQQKIKHYPFRRVGDHWEIEFFPDAKIELLMLKYYDIDKSQE